MIISENYLDPDVAYFLGLIVARGTLHESSGDKKIIIEFPYKSLQAKGITKEYVQEDHLFYSITQIKERLQELTEADISINQQGHSYALIIRFLRNSLVWRNSNYLLKGSKSYYDFLVPQQIFLADTVIQKEFIRGIADCAGFIRESNNYMGGKRRVYLEISNKNWILPIQICELLQKYLEVPVQLIQWGHPNTREPKQIKKRTWAREHQIKIFAEAFKKVGFYVKYKQEILDDFVKADQKISGKINICNPYPPIRRITKKPKHPEEKSPLIHPKLRGKHYNAYWQICVDLGCNQCIKIPKKQLSLLKEVEDVVED